MRQISPAKVARFLKGKALGRFAPKITPETAFPDVEIAHLGEAETLMTPELGSFPLAPPCRHLKSATYDVPRPRAMILPEVLYYPDQNQLLSHDHRILEEADQVPFRFHDLDLKPFFGMKVHAMPGICTTLRSFRGNHYHALVDNLPQLYSLEALLELRPDMAPIRLLLTLPLTPVEDYFLARLLPAGIDVHCVPEGVLYRMEKYLFVSFMSRRYAGYLPPRYVEWFRERSGVSTERSRRRRLFISRQKAAKGRHIQNEEAVLEVLEPLGFERILLEGMAVPRQIEAFAEAECVVAAHGAAFANLLFSSKTSVIELFPEPAVWPHAYFLSRTGAHRYQYLCHRAAGRDDDFLVDIPALRTSVTQALDGLQGS